MIDLNELAEKYQQRGEDVARFTSATAPAGFNCQDVAHATNCLTIAAHLRNAAEREKAEAAREPLSPPIGPRAPAPARLRSWLEEIVLDYAFSDETEQTTVDRILDTLIESDGHSLELRYAPNFLLAVKRGDL